MDTLRVPPARIVLELTEDGTYIMESYRDGARHREVLPRGLEWVEAREELGLIQGRLRAQIERQADKKAEAEARRARAVYFNTAYNHGVKFADEKVGRPQGVRLPAAAKAPAHAGAIMTSEDLLG